MASAAGDPTVFGAELASRQSAPSGWPIPHTRSVLAANETLVSLRHPDRAVWMPLHDATAGGNINVQPSAVAAKHYE